MYCDTYEQACHERDRLIEIANRQKSKTVLIETLRVRASDVVAAEVSMAISKPHTERIVWVHLSNSIDGRPSAEKVVFGNPEQAHKYAREIMEQVAGVRD